MGQKLENVRKKAENVKELGEQVKELGNKVVDDITSVRDILGEMPEDMDDEASEGLQPPRTELTDKLEQPESCRFNCIALYDGYYTEEGKQDNELFGDYANVRLFSKLNIPTEHLSLQKDLEIIYRVYGS